MFYLQKTLYEKTENATNIITCDEKQINKSSNNLFNKLQDINTKLPNHDNEEIENRKHTKIKQKI